MGYTHAGDCVQSPIPKELKIRFELQGRHHAPFSVLILFECDAELLFDNAVEVLCGVDANKSTQWFWYVSCRHAL
jgi:hypothetical protein